MPLPRHIQLYPTFRCNQRCSFCFNTTMPASDSAYDMPYRDALRLLSLCAAQGIPEIDIMGGEPLLLEWMPEFLRKGTAGGMRMNISTNGSLPAMMRRLAEIDRRLLTVGVSIEGSNMEQHGRLTRSAHFDDAVRSLSVLLDAGFDPLVKTVVNRATMPEIPGIIALVRDLGIRRYFLIHMDVLSGSPEELQLSPCYPEFLGFFRKTRDEHPGMEINMVAASCFDLRRLPGNVRCAGGVLKLAVAPAGSVYPCNLFIGVPDFNLGNVLSDGLDAIWNNHRLEFFRKRGGNACPQTACGCRPDCSGGCPAHGYYHFGDPAAPDIRCLQE